MEFGSRTVKQGKWGKTDAGTVVIFIPPCLECIPDEKSVVLTIFLIVKSRANRLATLAAVLLPSVRQSEFTVTGQWRDLHKGKVIAALLVGILGER